jgi:hypothetical protein
MSVRARIGPHGDTSDDDIEHGEQNVKVDIPFLDRGRLGVAGACIFDDESLVLAEVPWRIHVEIALARGRRDMESRETDGMCYNTVNVTYQARRGELFTLWKFSSAIGSPGQPCLADLTLFRL